MTTSSTLRLAIGFVASVLVARALGPIDLGVYAVLAAIAATVGAFAEFGLTESAVRRIAAQWDDRPDSAARTAATYLWLRIGMTTLVVLVAIVALEAGIVTNVALANPILLIYALLGIISTAMSGAMSGLLQATSRFGRLSLVMVANSLLTVALAMSLSLTGTLNLATALIFLGIGTSLSCFGLARCLLDRSIRLVPPAWSIFRAEAGQLLSFGRWLWLANSLAMLAVQVDLLLAKQWLAPATLGAYALAVTLASKAAVVNQSLHAVLMPFASSLRSPVALRSYLRRGLARSLVISGVVIIAAPVARPLIPMIFGADFRQSAGLFTALLGVAVVDLIATPVLMLAYTMDRPKLIALTDATRVLVLVIGAMTLLPLVGVFGLIVAKLLASMAGLVVTAVVLGRQLRSEGVVLRSLVTREGVAIQIE